MPRLLIITFTILLFCLFNCKSTTNLKNPSERPTNWAQKIQAKNFNNLYQVDSNVYRSEQPTRNGMHEIETLNIKSVLNLCNSHNDNYEAKRTQLFLIHIPINTWRISYKDLVTALQEIKNSPKPMLIHCLHGSDRTGAVLAAYQMVFKNWSKEDAIREFRYGGYGYHENYFPNILELLESIDIDQLKNDVENNE